MATNIWFVVHQQNLWDIDDKLIGFWNPMQANLIAVGDVIIYYRSGLKCIMGVFRVVQKGANLNRNFYDAAIVKKPIHQCRLELISNEIICGHPTTETRFSFYGEWSRNRYGGLKKQVFEAKRDDLKLIVADPLVVKLIGVN